MPKWQGVIFDLDGVLLNSQIVGRERFLDVARSLDLPISEALTARIGAMWGVPGYALVQACWPDMRVDTFMHQWETFDSQHPLPLFPGIQELLAVLSADLPLGMLTSRNWSTHAQLRMHDIDSYFRFVFTLDDTPAPKPDPRSIDPLMRLYRERCGITMQDLVFVGDAVHSDYGLARAIGMDFIAVTWGNNTRDEFLAAGVDSTRIANSIEHLLQILEQ